jgi:diaminopimelate epimerase
MSPSAPFEKYEGLGNDFILIEGSSEDDVSPARARALCDRRTGIGADGVLVILPSRVGSAVARMRVVNADGSIAEMCGNGLRCAALHLARRASIDRGELAIETDVGVRLCEVDRRGDEANVLCDMGLVRVQGDVEVEVAGERLTLTRVDAGNPHAVAFRAITREELERLGPPASAAPVFERGANVEFVHSDGDLLDVVVWERGAGATQACGTGACAAVAAACARGVLSGEGPFRVRLPGGELEIRHARASGRTSMRGPARRVFSGAVTRWAP